MKRWLPSLSGLTVAALAVIVTFTLRVKADDVWWHLGAGEFMLATHTLPTTNHFSFTAPEAPWLAHEWLSEVLFALVYRVAPSALALFATGLQVAAFGMLAVLARGRGRAPISAAFLTFVASLLLISNFSIRPYLFGNLALLTTLWLVEQPATGHRRVVLLFALFALWANLHGSFVFGLGVLGLWALTDRKRYRFIELVVATLACLATPHHVNGLLFPLLYLRTSMQRNETFLSNIMEWQRVAPTSTLGLVLISCLVVAAVIIVASKLRPRAAHLVLLVVFAFAAFSAVRNVALVAIALAVVLPRHLEALSKPSTLPEGTVVLPMFAWAMAALTTLGTPLPNDFMPRQAIAKLSPDARVFNSFNWGGALIFSGVPVFIDQRNDCYPPEVLRDYFVVHRVETGWLAVLDRWNIDTVLWPSGGALDDALRSTPGWHVVYEDEQATVFRRTR